MMMFRHTPYAMTTVLGASVCALMLTGCVMQEPPALTDIGKARSAIASAKAAGAQERFPDDFAALETRFLQARGTFYACQEAEASAMALDVASEAQALASRRVAVPLPPNQSPQAAMSFPVEEVEVDTPVSFDASASVDPEGDTLNYQWAFGDGATSTEEMPVHTYTVPGAYDVRLTVTDPSGASDTITDSLNVVRRVVLQQPKQERILFGFNRSSLGPGAQQALEIAIEEMASNDQLRAHIVGHADATGPESYNMGLSKRRAEWARDYMIAEGIPADSLTVEWRGESQPLVSGAIGGIKSLNQDNLFSIK